LTPQIENIVRYRLDIDAKTKLQETAQSIFKKTPVYKVIKEKGPDHSKVFTVQVSINRKVYGTGEGISKQKAEEEAAVEALKKISI
jgi:ribonuclease III